MNSRQAARTPADRCWAAAMWILISGFVIAFSARPGVVLSNAGLDDALFMQLGMNLASGRWLGGYNVTTLAKGAGFPIFLAITNVPGLPYPLSLALFHAASASFAAAVVRGLTRSRFTGFAVLATLLLTPTLYYGGLLGANRDFFYTSLTLAFVSASVAVATGCLGRPAPMAALAGMLGAWFWLTREEGVWIFPCLGLLLLVPILGVGRPAASAPARTLGSIPRGLAPAALAFCVAATLVVGFGLINWAVYGRFEINEIRDSAFQSAMSALQDASAPFHVEGVPVPGAARARIYAASPAFASIREPILDGPLQADATQWGCRENPKFCHDFGGGWFIWDLRNSAALHGEHATAAKAAAFYRRLAREVRQACADGRLTCQRWPVPLVPPMRASELTDVAASFRRMFHVFTFGEQVWPQPGASDLTGAGANAMVAFLNLPAVRTQTPRRRLTGWFVARSGEWPSLTPGEGVKVIEFTRAASPDVAGRFNDPRFGRSRFTLTADCPFGRPCPLTLAVSTGRTGSIDLATLETGGRQLCGGTLYIEDTGGVRAKRLLKKQFSRAWIGAVANLNPVFRGLAALGFAAWLVQLGQALARRRISTGLVVCTALLASVLARMVILALIDALSFVAASFNYALPGVALLVLFSVISLHEAIAGFARKRKPA